jgi:hypothetical protein
MPGGTSGEGKTPTSQQAQADKQRRGSRSSSSTTAETNSFLAALMTAAQNTARLPYQQEFLSQLEKPKFDPSEFLAAQRGLDEAYSNAADDATQAKAASTPYYAAGRSAPYAAAARQTLPEDVTDVDEVKDAQAAYDEQLRIRRADALNVDPTRHANPVNFKKETDSLTWSEYNDLSGLQKAAVDYNTMLVKAAKRDRRMQDQYNPTDDQRAQYEATVDKLFGESSGRGSATSYAPETVALLQQIGYKNDGAGDLDDFLNLDAAIREKDLAKLDSKSLDNIRRGGAGSMMSNPVKEERLDFLGGLASSTESAQAEALAKGNELLARYSTQALTNIRETTVDQLGGFASSETGVGFQGTALDTKFQQAFDLLADKNMNADNVLYAMQQELSPEERQQFIKYAEKRMLTAETERVPLTTTEGLVPRTPIEMAELLQLKGFRGGK